MVRETAILDDLPARLPEPALPADDLRLLHHFLHDNDAQAFGEIVRRYAGMVYATCLRIVGDAARAEDVSQDTFFRLISRGHEVHTSLPAWLHRTATHLAIDAIRSDGARQRRKISYCQTSDRAASTWAELSPAVDQALCDLPDEPEMITTATWRGPNISAGKCPAGS